MLLVPIIVVDSVLSQGIGHLAGETTREEAAHGGRAAEYVRQMLEWVKAKAAQVEPARDGLAIVRGVKSVFLLVSGANRCHWWCGGGGVVCHPWHSHSVGTRPKNLNKKCFDEDSI